MNNFTLFTEKMTTLLNAHIPALVCMQTLLDDPDFVTLRPWTSLWVDGLSQGTPLHTVLRKHPHDAWEAHTLQALEDASSPMDALEAVCASGLDVPDASLEKSDVFMNVLHDAVEAHATALHLDPSASGGSIRVRCEGRLRVLHEFERDAFQHLVSACKRCASLRPAPYASPQSGRALVRIGDESPRDLDLDIATFHAIQGEGAVVRITDQTRALEVLRNGELLFPNAEQRAEIFDAATFSHGLFIITGPTGCGKTTTAYSLFTRLNPRESKLFSIEKHFGLPLPDVQQLLVQNFSSSPNASPDANTLPPLGATLRHIERLDPDAILCCAFPTQETASTLVDLASTGHKVFVVCQEDTASKALQRFLDFGVDAQDLSRVFRGALSQRLVKKLCSSCKKELKKNPSVHYGEHVEVSFTADGCAVCYNTGRRGRTPLYDLLTPSQALKEALIAGQIVGHRDFEASLFSAVLPSLREGRVSLQDALEAVHVDG